MGLKATGSYLSRTLSYDGAEFSIAKVDVDPTFGYVLAVCQVIELHTAYTVLLAAVLCLFWCSFRCITQGDCCLHAQAVRCRKQLAQ